MQTIVEQLEEAFQGTFAEKQWKSVFVKGTGDGLVVITERNEFCPAAQADDPSLRFQRGHVVALVKACQRVLREFRERQGDLAVGCGIDCGSAKQVFLLGQSDYVGVPVNHASKIQQEAVNEVRMSASVLELLTSDDGGAALGARAKAAGEIFCLGVE